MKSLLLALALAVFWPGHLLLAQDPQGPQAPEASQAAPAPRPRLVIPEKEFDAQLRPPGSSVTHEFAVHNQGDDDLTLEVVPGCGCTVASYDKTIAPGESGTIAVTVDLYE
ncbi:MAG: DUF1573 domain-containing protein, partial [Deltaproteobacteria bacterium]|nr:DUF1573 domain-containing protein [Deltaproteobacteria bacterium]